MNSSLHHIAQDDLDDIIRPLAKYKALIKKAIARYDERTLNYLVNDFRTDDYGAYRVRFQHATQLTSLEA